MTLRRMPASQSIFAVPLQELSCSTGGFSTTVRDTFELKLVLPRVTISQVLYCLVTFRLLGESARGRMPTLFLTPAVGVDIRVTR